MHADDKRLLAVTRLLAEAHDKLGLKFGFRLWDGSSIPADWPENGLAVAIRDPGAIAGLIRRPRLDTLLNLHVTDHIALVNGSLFDLVAARPDGKVGRLARAISTGAILSVVRHFVFAPGPKLAVATRPPGNELERDGDPARNKANIAYHYDVSNAFYRLFLDEDMVYTCAYFTEDHTDLHWAQRDKLDMVCRKLRLRPGDRFLDIGCGWGALVCHAARYYGVEAHGVTLAEEQLKLARATVERLGLQDRVTLHLRDYRLMDGSYDKISSIGMFEHVGIRNHPDYFRTVHRLLAPRGLYLHHSISRRAKKTDRAFNRMPAEYRALVRYIFPGGELDHLGMSIANLERYGFEVHDVEGWREHYRRTTRLWWERLEARKQEAEVEIGPERTRMWLLYLAGCSLAFSRGGALVNQTLVSRRGKGPAPVPLTRADLYA